MISTASDCVIEHVITVPINECFLQNIFSDIIIFLQTQATYYNDQK